MRQILRRNCGIASGAVFKVSATIAVVRQLRILVAILSVTTGASYALWKVMSTRKANKGNSRSVLRRSRALERHEEKIDRSVERQLDLERAQNKSLSGKKIPPCLDCGNIQRERRRYIRPVRRWVPFCTFCWVARGKPTYQVAQEMVAEVEAERKVAGEKYEVERQKRVDAGELPW